MDAFHIQNLIRLSLAHKDRGANSTVRGRLLWSILDCFSKEGRGGDEDGRVDQAWSSAASRLGDIRSLQDVAAGIGLTESAFRTLHRLQFSNSAGRHLQELRMREAEQLLATTGLSISEISNAVGYGHAESFSASFTHTPTDRRVGTIA